MVPNERADEAMAKESRRIKRIPGGECLFPVPCNGLRSFNFISRRSDFYCGLTHFAVEGLEDNVFLSHIFADLF